MPLVYAGLGSKKIQYHPGKDNIDPDAFILDDTAYMETYTQIVQQDVLQAVACQQNRKTKDKWTGEQTVPNGTDMTCKNH